MPELAPPPLTYFAKLDKQTRLKTEWTIEGEKHSAELPVYNDTAAEDYFCSIK